MSRFTFHSLLLVACLSLTGCASSFHGGYYDPCGGCVYGPGFHTQKPGLLTKLFKKDHNHKHDCPLCAAEHDHGHGHSQSWSDPSCAAPNCAAPSYAPNCAAPANCSAPAVANCSAPSDCSCSGGVSYDPGQIAYAPSNCSSCGGGYVESAPFSSGCSGCAGEAVSGCASCGGDVISGDVYNGGCSACEGGTIGPMYEGEIIPGDAPSHPVKPAPAPAAEPESAAVPGPPTTYVTPGPQSTMMIPAFVEKQEPARQVHWVPSSLK
jgi:hypothetical protein